MNRSSSVKFRNQPGATTKYLVMLDQLHLQKSRKIIETIKKNNGNQEIETILSSVIYPDDQGGGIEDGINDKKLQNLCNIKSNKNINCNIKNSSLNKCKLHLNKSVIVL